MTSGEIIVMVDELEPNQYSTTNKLQWLSELDGKIINDVISTHLPPPAHHLLPHWPDPLARDRRPWMPAPGEPICAKPPEPNEEPEEKEERKPPYHSGDDILVIMDPYGSSVYSHYLQAKIASENSEIGKYNQQMVLFNSAYQEFCDYYNRTYMPTGPRGGNRIRF